MPARRTVAAATATTAASLLLVSLVPTQASAHGSMQNPVSRVSACYAEGPETPKSQVCKDLIAMSGTQPLYDWNEVNIANANGQSRQLIPDGKLCSANRDKYKALDMARTDWPATNVSAGSFNFRFRVTAPHSGTMELYITKAGYNPTQPLKWSDLQTTPVASTATGRTSSGGFYNFTGTLPSRTGRHLLYMVWQRNDSPEAFYSCSDIVFGQGVAGARSASAPTDQQIAAGASRSTVGHHGHGGDVPGANTAVNRGAAKGTSVVRASAPLTTSGSARMAADEARNPADGGTGVLSVTLMGATVLAAGSAAYAFTRRRTRS
ncbi:lytic polysaccharide monooxygenase auxiliary activity family 9 protein [Wenjunlia tyrosinilytica]|uniref:Chitin-binding protein n=1 Tax=Wenjunlia tyrosinilytica TaxID=1544741 RepID=A0A917ZUC8_9ACTN|nr:lytic polysaccharide monooxygenase [Wenjunlia tyrosinilytica]GGO90603.1 chitin-binding protein [Wenjunlia tyrosinilytica]